MPTAIITSKGRITIPVDIRHRLGLAFGDRIEFSLNSETGQYEIYPVTRSLTALKGIVDKPVNPVSIEDMNRTIAELCQSTIS